jgi:hypothetical protein
VSGLEVDEDAEPAIKSQSTSPGMVIGTANHMSPEQAKGKEVDGWKKIFSNGHIFHHDMLFTHHSMIYAMTRASPI